MYIRLAFRTLHYFSIKEAVFTKRKRNKTLTIILQNSMHPLLSWGLKSFLLGLAWSRHKVPSQRGNTELKNIVCSPSMKMTTIWVVPNLMFQKLSGRRDLEAGHLFSKT